MFRYAIFTDEDGNPLAVDPTDIQAIGVDESERNPEQMVTRLYFSAGDWFAVVNDFEEVKAKIESMVNAED